MAKKKILIMGLQDQETSLAKRLYPYLKAVFLNNDEVRKANDWDFSPKGRERQTKRMKDLAQKYLNEGKKCNS